MEFMEVEFYSWCHNLKGVSCVYNLRPHFLVVVDCTGTVSGTGQSGVGMGRNRKLYLAPFGVRSVVTKGSVMCV